MTISSPAYIKVIVIKLDPFESVIVDEANFGINERDRIELFKNKYNSKIYGCSEYVIE